MAYWTDDRSLDREQRRLDQQQAEALKEIDVNKRTVGRPKTITDMKAYKREKAREYRANKKGA